MTKNLRKDTRAENIAKPFILLIGTMLLFAFIAAILTQAMNNSAQSVNNGIVGDIEILGLYEYTLISPQTGYDITTGSTHDHMIYPKDTPLIFTDENHSNDKKYIQIIRNNLNYDPASSDMWKKYKDFISVQRETPELYVGTTSKWRGAAISFDSIIANLDPITNWSIISFDFSKTNDTLFVKLASNNTALLWSNSFTLFYGWTTLREDRIDFWATIGMVLTGQVPGLNPKIQFIISSFWVLGYIFMGYTLVTRIVPGLGGS